MQPGFREASVWNNLTRPVAVRFAPDGRVFVAEKRGRIVTYDSIDDPTPTEVSDLRNRVHDFWDRGMLGLAIHPQFPTKPWIYVLYTLDAAVGGTPPLWGDACPNPPGATADGCVVGARLSRLELTGTTAGPETVLLEEWGQQYPSHSIGDLAFGRDGALYVTSGDGASFNFVDYGQDGNPRNPLGDPPVAVGEAQTAPTARGGALRSQSLRRPSGEPVLLNGTVLRLDPETGAAMPGNPLASHTNANAQRIVAQGLRNPFRMAMRPGTDEIWVGDVGWSTWEEIERITNPVDARIENFGWPCYEGRNKQGGYDSANLDLCETLYANPTEHDPPYYTYNHSAKIVAGETCPDGGSAITGLTFYTGTAYPERYRGALFFADHARKCAWAMLPGADGLPDPTKIETFAAGAATPVDIQVGPDGNIYYVDIDGGSVRRIRYLEPRAVAVGTPTAGAAPLAVSFDGTMSQKALFEDTLTYAWDLDGDGEFDDSNEEKPEYLYATTSTRSVKLKVTDQRGVSSVSDPVVIQVSDMPMSGGQPPVPVIDAPTASFTWTADEVITFTGHATDPDEGTLPATALQWLLVLQHCPDGCHAHVLQSWNGVAGASFPAPDHEYPSYLELVLTATDASGAKGSTSLRLQPKTVWLTLQAVPTGAQLTMAGVDGATPFARPQIRGGTTTVAAPSPQVSGGMTWAFLSWSDGGTLIHQVGPLSDHTALTARFRPAGLTAEYFANVSLTGSPALVRTDATPSFDWGNGAPGGTLPANNFSVRWTGFVEAPATESYRFITESDDGVRLWVNDTLVIDNWTDHGATQDTSPPVALTAGVKVPIKMEYYEKGGGSIARLSWRSASVPEQAISAGQLWPGCPGGTCGAGLTCVAGACEDACAAITCADGQRCRAGACEDACGGLSCGDGMCTNGKCVDVCHGVTCPVGQRCDQGSCIDLCMGVTCPAGQRCEAGACVDACKDVACPSGQGCQLGVCVDLCAGVNCPAGQKCEAGTCVDACKGVACPAGEKCRLGGCVDACTDVVCAAGEICKAGACVDACTDVACPGQKCVAGRCVDLCTGVDCPSGEKCVAGACVPLCTGVSCPDGQKCLAGDCVSSCTGVSCPEGAVCDAGSCVDPCTLVSCQPGTVCQGGACVDGCIGVTCPRGSLCVGGACVDQCLGVSCQPGFVCESGACVDPCASLTCPDGKQCRGGACVDPCAGVTCDGSTVCRGGQCVDPCGGVSCSPGERCVAGACVPACQGVTCPAGDKCLDGACVALCTGVACAEGQKCVLGACVPLCEGITCPAGETCVGGTCVDQCTVVTCPPNQACRAGACVDVCLGVMCAVGQRCQQGTCVDACLGVTCAAGQRCQLGTCVDACLGVTCAEGQRCQQGTCVDACLGVMCAVGQRCQQGTCVDACLGVMCAVGQRCQQGTCVDACLGVTCAEGQRCQLGTCVVIAAEDAGTDAAPAPTDAAGPDGPVGTDALGEPTDAQPTEPRDAGAPDRRDADLGDASTGGTDAGDGGLAGDEGGDCSCRIGGPSASRTPAGAWAMLALSAVAWMRQTRRRRAGRR